MLDLTTLNVDNGGGLTVVTLDDLRGAAAERFR
jgi:hypothetical protein